MIYFILYIWLFYLSFVLYAGCQHAIITRQYTVLIPCAPVLLVAGLMDVLFNFTLGRILFWELTNTFTFSERLDLHYTGTGWRGSLAGKIGNVLDEILPGHIS